MTLRPDPSKEREPGKSTGWHDRGPDGDAPEDKMAPDDSRNVTGAVPAGSAPGADSGWRGVEGQGKAASEDAAEPSSEMNPEGAAAARSGPVGKGTEPPEGVPQHAEPYSAEEAAAARSHQE